MDILNQTTRNARIIYNERKIKIRKQEFGVDLYDVMERNRNLGDKTGGEAMPELVNIFHDYNTFILVLLEKRKKKHYALTRISKPKAICIDDKVISESSDSSIGPETSRPPSPPAPEESSPPPTPEESLSSVTTTISSNNDNENSFNKSFNNVKYLVPKPIRHVYTTLERKHCKSKLKGDIVAIDKDIHVKKEEFGIEMYDTMISFGETFIPRDITIEDVFVRARNDISIIKQDTVKVEKEINDVRKTGAVRVSHDDVKEIVNSNPTLWAMLSVNLPGISEEECKDVAFRVALELISGINGKKSYNAPLTKRRYKRFEKLYLKTPKGTQEFFHRSVYLAFDSDWNGQLDNEETDRFLDTFYVTGSIFQGDSRLPKKEQLKQMILEKLDDNGDGQFTFEEIRSLITGTASISASE